MKVLKMLISTIIAISITACGSGGGGAPSNKDSSVKTVELTRANPADITLPDINYEEGTVNLSNGEQTAIEIEKVITFLKSKMKDKFASDSEYVAFESNVWFDAETTSECGAEGKFSVRERYQDAVTVNGRNAWGSGAQLRFRYELCDFGIYSTPYLTNGEQYLTVMQGAYDAYGSYSSPTSISLVFNNFLSIDENDKIISFIDGGFQQTFALNTSNLKANHFNEYSDLLGVDNGYSINDLDITLERLPTTQTYVTHYEVSASQPFKLQTVNTEAWYTVEITENLFIQDILTNNIDSGKLTVKGVAGTLTMTFVDGDISYEIDVNDDGIAEDTGFVEIF